MISGNNYPLLYGLFGVFIILQPVWPSLLEPIDSGVIKRTRGRLFLKVFLGIGNWLAFQGSILKWCALHRIHHRFTDQIQDPYSVTDGLWHAHIGWVIKTFRKELHLAVQGLDVSDLTGDKFVVFQDRHYWMACFLWNLVFPFTLFFQFGSAILCTGFLVVVCFRYIIIFHFSSLVNSAAHYYGDRPYAPAISSRQNLCVAILAAGEGWHNYHHRYPADYATNEWGWNFNFTTLFIDLCRYLGLARNAKRFDLATKRYIVLS